MICNGKTGTGRRPFVVLALCGVLVWMLTANHALGWEKAKYTDSAHGTTAFGVKRRVGTASADYGQGNCAHCHEQHGSINGVSHTPYAFALFEENDPESQTDNFCFQCHKTGSVQQGGVVYNYTYSKNFGGGTITFDTIYKAFNPTTGDTPSSHSLFDIHRYVRGRQGFSMDANACIACHDPHTAQRNFGTIVIDPVLGGVNTAIRRPLDYAQRRPNLWGDESFAHSGFYERMVDITPNYQAPFYVGIKNPVTGPFEPAGDSIYDGSNLPNFATFCLDCHKNADVYSSERGANLIPIIWTSDGDEHGAAHADGDVGVTAPPYGNGSFNYILNCTDCHEPHGSENEWLLRTCANGEDDLAVPGANRWLDFCSACHDVNQHTSPWDNTTDCYNNGLCHKHGQFF